MKHYTQLNRAMPRSALVLEDRESAQRQSDRHVDRGEAGRGGIKQGQRARRRERRRGREGREWGSQSVREYTLRICLWKALGRGSSGASTVMLCFSMRALSLERASARRMSTVSDEVEEEASSPSHPVAFSVAGARLRVGG
jgi:hypothetical protein